MQEKQLLCLVAGKIPPLVYFGRCKISKRSSRLPSIMASGTNWRLHAPKEIAADLGVEHHILDMGLLNQLAPNALTREDIAVKAGEDGQLPNTFVEGRNMLFLTLQAYWPK